MSIINKMLQDLDRRNAIGAGEAQPAHHYVKPVTSGRQGQEWFWRVVALLVLAALVWVGWVAYQLQPRLLATDMAHDTARRVTAAVAKPASAGAPPAPAPSPQEGEPAGATPPLEVETFKLARAIETPIAARVAELPKPQPLPKPPAPKAPVPVAAPSEAPAKAPVAAASIQPAAAAPAAPALTRPTVERQERGRTPAETAEGHFRRAAALLNQARVSEAQAELVAALQADPAHGAARQAHIALLLEHNRVDAAEALLRDGVSLHPHHSAFTLTLGRILAERGQYAAALETVERGTPQPEHHALRGALLQRLGRHAEAVGAYEQAVQNGQQPAGTWTGLAISLEALGRRADAAQAYRHALDARPLPGELRDFAEDRLRALRGG